MEIHWATMLRAQLIGENAVKLGIKDAEIILFFVLFDKRICSLERKVLLYLFTASENIGVRIEEIFFFFPVIDWV